MHRRWRTALASPPRETARTELLDRPGVPPGELARNLRDIARLNRLGSTPALLRRAAPLVTRAAHAGVAPISVVDVGTGGADVPLALVRWARARGHRVRVVALDASPAVLACARLAARGADGVRLIAGDALRLPLRSGSVDLALCSLTLHHLTDEAVVGLLRTMADVARVGFVVSDLRRSRAAIAAAWLATRLLSTNRLTRHDGPLSVRRAYTPHELARLAAAADLPGMRWRRARFFRIIGVWTREPPG